MNLIIYKLDIMPIEIKKFGNNTLIPGTKKK